MTCVKGAALVGYTPDEIIQQFELLGCGSVSRSTLVRDARAGLIPSPEVRSLGRGLGVSSIYPREALAEFVAARLLVGTQIPREPVVIERYHRSQVGEPLARVLDKKGVRWVTLSIPPRKVSREDVRRIRARAYAMTEEERETFKPEISINRPIEDMLWAKGTSGGGQQWHSGSPSY